MLINEINHILSYIIYKIFNAKPTVIWVNMILSSIKGGNNPDPSLLCFHFLGDLMGTFTGPILVYLKLVFDCLRGILSLTGGKTVTVMVIFTIHQLIKC